MAIDSDQVFMRRALAMAERASAVGEVPVGAVLVKDGQIIAEGHNQPIGSCDPSAHAEMVALRRGALAEANYRLPGCDLYVTIEPCVMCVGAMLHARLRRVIFGALEPRAGALQSQLQLLDMDHYNHRIDWRGGVLEHDCGDLMRTFFRARRAAGGMP